MTFKEQAAKDIMGVFMDKDVFSGLHIINGREMTVQFDNNEMVEREKRYRHMQDMHSDGIFLGELLIYVVAEEFGNLPASGRVLTLDGQTYTVKDAIDEDGIYSITLEANKTGRKRVQ